MLANAFIVYVSVFVCGFGKALGATRMSDYISGGCLLVLWLAVQSLFGLWVSQALKLKQQILDRVEADAEDANESRRTQNKDRMMSRRRSSSRLAGGPRPAASARRGRHVLSSSSSSPGALVSATPAKKLPSPSTGLKVV